MISRCELRALRFRVEQFAGQNAVVSVRAFGDCERALMAAIARRAGRDRAEWVERARRHFQILKAAAAEKATRGKA